MNKNVNYNYFPKYSILLFVILKCKCDTRENKVEGHSMSIEKCERKVAHMHYHLVD